LGSAVVSTAVFGVSPKTFKAPESSRVGDSGIIVPLAGETPAKATGTVALPNPSESLRRRCGGCAAAWKIVWKLVSEPAWKIASEMGFHFPPCDHKESIVPAAFMGYKRMRRNDHSRFLLAFRVGHWLRRKRVETLVAAL
jgi:hypothetical protein